MADAFGIYGTLLGRVEALLEAAKEEIRAEMEAKGINASGRTSDSFRVERYDGGVRLVMGGPETAPLETLEVGRPGGNVPGGFVTTKAGVRDVSNTFKAILVRWAREKGIEGFGWGHATILGRRISDEGTLRHKNPTVVYTEAVAKARDEIMRTATVTVTEKLHDELLKITPNNGR